MSRGILDFVWRVTWFCTSNCGFPPTYLNIYSGRLFDKVSLSANKLLNSRNLSTPTFVTIMLSTGCIPRMMIRRFAHKAIDNATAHSLISILFEKLLVVMTNKKWKSSQCLKITQNSHFYHYQCERSEQVFYQIQLPDTLLWDLYYWFSNTVMVLKSRTHSIEKENR